MVAGLNHVSFTVENLDLEIEFYKRAFGFELSSLAERNGDYSSGVTGLRNVELKAAFLAAKNGAIELIQYTSGSGTRIDTRTCNLGSAHVALDVDDFDEVVARAKEAGGKQVGLIMSVPAGPNKGKRVVYLEDPEGNTIEVIGE